MLLNSSNSCNRSGLVVLVEGHRESGINRGRLFGTCCWFQHWLILGTPKKFWGIFILGHVYFSMVTFWGS